MPAVAALIALVFLIPQQRAETFEEWQDILVDLPVGRVEDALSKGRGMWGLGVEKEAEKALSRLLGQPEHAPFVERDVYQPVCARLQQAATSRGVDFVVVSGPSKAGKSRLLLEAAGKSLSHAWLLRPTHTPEALNELARRGPPRSRARKPVWLVWLDDVEEFLGSAGTGLSLDTLDEFARWPGSVIVLGAEGGKGVQHAHDAAERFADTLRDLLERYQPRYWLRPEVTASESAALDPAIYPASLTDELVQAGIGRFMIAARDLEERLTRGPQEGVAAVRTAIDWHRTGLLRPIPKPDLTALYPLDEHSLERGLEWATTPVYSDVALLIRDQSKTGGEAYRAYDYIVHYIDASVTESVPKDLWQYVIDQVATTEELAERVGIAAFNAGQLEVAEDAFRRADERGHARGALNLGAALERRAQASKDTSERERLAGEAHAAYSRADERGDAAGAFKVGVLSERRAQATEDPSERERLAGEAHAAYARADERGDAAGAAKVGVLLERRAEDTSDPSERERLLGAAHAAYRRADARGDAAGAYKVGLLYEHAAATSGTEWRERNRLLDQAQLAFERADKRGDARGSIRLGHSLEQQAYAQEYAYARGDDWVDDELLGEAWAAYKRAEALGDAMGAITLGESLERRADASRDELEEERFLGQAAAAFQRADERGEARGAIKLGDLLERRAYGSQDAAEGKRLLDEAWHAFRRADERGIAEGAFGVGLRLEQQAEMSEDTSQSEKLLREAQTAYKRADERGHPRAASNLGVLFERLADTSDDPLERERLLGDAQAAYARADERRDRAGAMNLGLLLERRAKASDDPAERDRLLGEAQDAYTRAAHGASEFR